MYYDVRIVEMWVEIICQIFLYTIIYFLMGMCADLAYFLGTRRAVGVSVARTDRQKTVFIILFVLQTAMKVD